MKLIYVFPNAPAFGDLRTSYASLAKRTDAVLVVDPAEGERALLQGDADVLCVFFNRPSRDTLSQPRRAKASFVYTEPLSPESAMSSDGRAYRKAFFDVAALFDAVFLHTPDMCAEMQALIPEALVELLPVGFDPVATVEPDWSCAKTIDFLFYGAMAGKRVWSVLELYRRMNARLVVTNDCYGQALGNALNRARASVYLVHSDVTSFSTWRIWQTLSSSAALVAEGDENSRVDAWPLVSGRDYIALPKITRENVKNFAEKLNELTSERLHDVALRAQEVRGRFTSARCVEDYLVPAANRIFVR